MALSDLLIAKKLSESRRDINQYSRQAGRALGKQGAWAGFGRMLGGLGAPLAAAAMLSGPIGWAGTALATGIGSYLGGRAGRYGARTSKEGRVGKMEGGPSSWMQGSRETVKEDVADMRQYLKESNISESVKAGIIAGIKVGGEDLVAGLKAKLGGAASATGAAVPTTPATPAIGADQATPSIAQGPQPPSVLTDAKTSTLDKATMERDRLKKILKSEGKLSDIQQSTLQSLKEEIGSATEGLDNLYETNPLTSDWSTAKARYNTQRRFAKEHLVGSPQVSEIGRVAEVAEPSAGIFSAERMWGTGLKRPGSPYAKLAAGVRGVGDDFRSAGQLVARDFGRTEGNIMMGLEGIGTGIENLQLGARSMANRLGEGMYPVSPYNLGLSNIMAGGWGDYFKGLGR